MILLLHVLESAGFIIFIQTILTVAPDQAPLILALTLSDRILESTLSVELASAPIPLIARSILKHELALSHLLI